MKKQSVIKQILGVFFNHLIISIFMLIVLMGLISFSEKYFALKIAISIISILIYFFFSFTKAYEYATDDLKSYSTLKPYALKGLVLSSWVAIVCFILWILHFMAWKFIPITDQSISYVTLFINAGCLVMTAPFLDIVNMKGPDADLFGKIISITIPMISSFIGYYSGYIKWDYIKYFNKFVYEKKSKRK